MDIQDQTCMPHCFPAPTEQKSFGGPSRFIPAFTILLLILVLASLLVPDLSCSAPCLCDAGSESRLAPDDGKRSRDHEITTEQQNDSNEHEDTRALGLEKRESTTSRMSKMATAPSPATSRSAAQVSTGSAHMARFEFSDLGTKILMVEWHPDEPSPLPSPSPSLSSLSSSASPDNSTTSDTTVPTVAGRGARSVTPPSDTAAAESAAAAVSNSTTRQSTGMEAAGWEVSWPGKSTFLPARETDDEDEDVDEAGPRRRVYFLLPPEASVPAQVIITPPGRSPILVKPLPAIFPSGFNLEAGPCGVLHTLWAKKRLLELEREMEAEMRANTESVGLEMAMAEKDWIVANFLEAKPPPGSCDGQPCDGVSVVPVPLRSPGPGRLADKLKGLRLGTSAADLVPSSTAKPPPPSGPRPPSQTSHPPHGGHSIHPSESSVLRDSPYPTPQSLDAAIRGEPAPVSASSRDGEDELFALPLSPRSPDMKRGPFNALPF
ncbi:hypothetical protein E4U31_007284 [Claviceps sp. LM219 group G6]|nr:hypothetical protein E4U31_007284 [Claviceps sp. LM219 group G6]